MSASHAAFEGERFGPYRVLSKLASGGMADVWFVETVASSQRGVLKTMLPELAASSELRSLFIEEGRVAAELQHENIAKVMDVGVLDGRAYIAMEFVHGRTLRQIAQQCLEQHRRVDTWFLLRVLLEVCSALEYLHSYADAEGWHLGLVHGDVSPENIMVAFNGSVKLVDFGITRAANKNNLLIGKPWYMAPEQIQATATVDHRSDLYAVGVVLYECLTGYRPYTGATHADVLARALEGRPAPPQEIARGISEPLAWTALRAMARDPDHRFSAAADLAAALRARLRELDAGAHPRSLDGYMASLFGEPDTLASTIMRTISERTEHRDASELPTAPCAPSVIAEAIARAQSTPPPALPATQPVPAPTMPSDRPPVERSGEFPAQRVHVVPDIFARVPRREFSPVFGGAAMPRTSPMGGRARSAQESEAARLFEDGLSRLSAKDFSGAQEAWQRAIELDPRERRYQINLKRLQERFRDGDQ